MIRSIHSTFRALFKPKKYYQTFTYYVPAPPKRNTGYREKELDKYISGLFKDYQIESLTTESHQGSSAGMWVIVLLSTMDKKLSECNLNYPDSIQEDSHSEIEIILERD
ncbi:MAG: hypothetical protein ACOYL6_14020 [Bacteriovoracaceae bacterium]